MSKVLFLGIPSHGHVNPTLGLASELVKRGEEVIYFSSSAFRGKVEETGAIFKEYAVDLDFFKMRKPGSDSSPNPLLVTIRSGSLVVRDILEQTQDLNFDYIVHSAAFPFVKPLAQILKLPTVSSLAVFAGMDTFLDPNNRPKEGPFGAGGELAEVCQKFSAEMLETYGVEVPDNLLDLLFNQGDLNLVYTSKYFAENIKYFDETYLFVGPPVYARSEDLDFPFEKLTGQKVLYISLGTVFSGFSLDLYRTFFEAFADWNGVVVMAAYGIDSSQFEIPSNFIVRNYVPQNEILKYATVAITHCGMNSMNDLLSREIPLVALPMGADQPALAARAQELGAIISLDVKTVDAQDLRQAVDRVLSDPSYLKNIQKISRSFREAGGYPRAVTEIFNVMKSSR